METMNYREKKKKSLKLPIFALTSFLALGSAVVAYRNNERRRACCSWQ
ncbi:MAG: hypothetical protein IJ809_03515 [Clostridia bacterium]|nr:hypothetical protein [Clostridia bacterium]